MTAAALAGPESIRVLRRPVPEPAPGEVRLRVEACGLCGSDLRFFHLGPIVADTTPGHEMVGTVDALGDGVAAFATGDRVAVEPLSSCGGCDSCRAGRDAICREQRFYGVHRHGGFAEYVCVPDHRLYRVPDGLPAAVAALAEPMAVSVHGLRLGRFEAGQRVLVLGAGTIGLTAVRAAASLGASEVWLTARYPHQAELGCQMGATRVLTEEEGSPESLAALGIEAPIDLVVETVGGAADTLRSATAAVRPGGTISVLGLFMGDVALPALQLFLKENAVVWSNCYGRTPEGADFDTAVDLVVRHRSELSAVTTHQVPLEEIGRAYALAGDKKSGAIKVSVLP